MAGLDGPLAAGGDVRRQERVIEEEPSDLVAERETCHVIEPEVLPGVDPAHARSSPRR